MKSPIHTFINNNADHKMPPHVTISGGGVTGTMAAYSAHSHSLPYSLAKPVFHSDVIDDSTTEFMAVSPIAAELSDFSSEFLISSPVSEQVYSNSRFLTHNSTLQKLARSENKLNFKNLLRTLISKPRNADTDISSFDNVLLNKFGLNFHNDILAPLVLKQTGLSPDKLVDKFWAIDESLQQYNIPLLGRLQSIHDTSSKRFEHFEWKNGFSEFQKKIITDLNAVIELDKPAIQQLNHDHHKIISASLDNGSKILIDQFLDFHSPVEILKLLNPSAPENILDLVKKINHRDLITYSITLNQPPALPAKIVHFPETKYPFTRIKQHAIKKSDTDISTTYFLEIPCGSDQFGKQDEIDRLKDGILDKISKVIKCNRSDIVKDSWSRNTAVYPVLSEGTPERLRYIQRYLKQFTNLTRIGPAAEFRYMNIPETWVSINAYFTRLGTD